MRYIFLVRFLLTVNIVFGSCHILAATSCIDLLSQVSLNNQEYLGVGFNTMFLNTRRFINLVSRINRLQVDPQSSEYKAFIEDLSTKIFERKKAIENVLGREETVVFSTTASEGDLVIRFVKSKTYILIHLENYSRHKEYDHKWDRYYTEEYREKFKSVSELWSNLCDQVRNIELPKTDKLVCRGICRFFFVKKRNNPDPPDDYLNLDKLEIEYLKKLFSQEVEKISDESSWSELHEKYSGSFFNDNKYRATWYTRGGLDQYLRARRIPKDRWVNYRVNKFGIIEVNIKKEPFDTIPWGSVKYDIVKYLSTRLIFLRSLNGNEQPANLLIDYIRNSGLAFSETNLFLLRPNIRDVSINQVIELYELKFGLNSRFKSAMIELKQELQFRYSEDYVNKKSQLLKEAKNKLPKDITKNYFEIEGIKIPIKPFEHQLVEIQDYIKLINSFESLNPIFINSLPYRVDSLMRVYRAVFVSESNNIYDNGGVIKIPTDMNFEPYFGNQVRKFRNSIGYSGEVIELKDIPGYLLIPSEVNSPLHPEIRFRFPTVMEVSKIYEKGEGPR